VHGGDPPRLLAARSERGYTERVAEAMRGEAEAVDRETQQRQTLDAHRRWEQEQARAWGRAASTIDQALSDFKQNGHPSPQLLADVAAIERATQRADRHLGMSA
jgi:hypothetical protein